MADTASTSATRNRRLISKDKRRWLFFVGDWKGLTKFLVNKRYNSAWAPLKFIDALLRGYGQVIFANNPISGLLIVIVLSVANPEVSLAGLITATIGLITSILMKQDPIAVSTGLTVYNPLLVGLITSSVLPSRFDIEMDPIMWIFVIITTIFAVYVTSAVSTILDSLGRFPIPCFTLPFNIVQVILFLCVINMRPYFNGSVLNNVTSAPQSVITKPTVPSEETPTSRIYSSVNTELFQLTEGHFVEQPHIFRTTYLSHEDAKVLNTNADKVSSSRPPLQITQSSTPSKVMDFTFAKKEKSDSFAYTTAPTTAPAPVSKVIYQLYPTAFNIVEDSPPTLKIFAIPIGTTQAGTFTLPASFTAGNDLQYAEKTPDGESKNITLTPIISQVTDAPQNLSNSSFDHPRGETTQSITTIPYLYNRLPTEPASLFESEREIISDTTDDSFDTVPDTTTATTITTENSFIENVTLRRDARSLEQNGTSNATTNFTNEWEEHSNHVDWGKVFAGIILSMSQVYGYCDAPAAVTMYLALMIYSPTMTAFAITGSTLGSLTGLVFSEAPYTSVYQGQWGWNGLLCACALGGYCYVLTIHSAAAAIFCSIFTTAVQNVLLLTYEKVNLTPMSLPFNLAAILFLYVTSASPLVFPRPESISFPERHFYEHRRAQRRKKESTSKSASVTSLGRTGDAEKRAPLAAMDDL